jgi:hypothetical protein
MDHLQHLDALLADFDPAAPGTLLRERWKYSRISAFAEALDAPPGTDEPTRAPGPFQLRGQHAEAVPLSAPEALALLNFPTQEWAPYPFAAAALRTGNGWSAAIDQTSAPTTIDWRNGNGFAVIPVTAGSSQELTVANTGSGGGIAALFLSVGENASLTLNLDALRVDGQRWLLCRVELARNASLKIHSAASQPSRLRLETHVIMAGEGSTAALTGAALVDGQDKLDQQLLVEHRAPRAHSTHRYHCVGAGSGQSTFGGRIHIHAGASGSVAELSNRNLALSKQCALNTKPELEIYNDDVRCAHGATVGQLDEDALFYLRARGVSEVQARRLLTAGFLRETLQGALADPAAAAFAEALR